MTLKIVVFTFAVVISSSLISAAPEAEGHSRLKRSVFICDFFNEAGFKCNGCHEAVACLPFNIGTVTTCGGLFPYCRNGFCSMLKGKLCDNSTTTSNTAETTTAATSGTTMEITTVPST